MFYTVIIKWWVHTLFIVRVKMSDVIHIYFNITSMNIVYHWQHWLCLLFYYVTVLPTLYSIIELYGTMLKFLWHIYLRSLSNRYFVRVTSVLGVMQILSSWSSEEIRLCASPRLHFFYITITYLLKYYYCIGVYISHFPEENLILIYIVRY